MKRIGPKLAEWYAQHAGEQASASKVAKLEARGERVTALVVLGLNPDPNGRISIEDERMAVGCAAQNMYLTCTAHGIGGFWSTPKFLQLPEVKAFVGLPDNGEVLGIFYMGYPEDGAWPKSHRKPLEYVTDWNDSARYCGRMIRNSKANPAWGMKSRTSAFSRSRSHCASPHRLVDHSRHQMHPT